jgi:TfoX/Sxy family transcriptional regulator of competence genes
MSYYEAPVEVLEDARQLTEWARRSVAAAMRAPPREPKLPRRSPGRRRPRALRARR